MTNTVVNQKQIAATLGISQIHVSRALSGKGYVSDAIRDRVLRTAEKMGYQPNLLARGLARKKSMNVGLLFPLDNRFLGYGILGSAVLFMQSHNLLKAGYNPVILSKQFLFENTDAYLANLQVDGIIAFSMTGYFLNIFKKTGKPVVSMYPQYQFKKTGNDNRLIHILVDKKSGITELAEYTKKQKKKLCIIGFHGTQEKFSDTHNSYFKIISSLHPDFSVRDVFLIPRNVHGIQHNLNKIIKHLKNYSLIFISNHILPVYLQQMITAGSFRPVKNTEFVYDAVLPFTDTVNVEMKRITYSLEEMTRIGNNCVISAIEKKGIEKNYIIPSYLYHKK